MTTTQAHPVQHGDLVTLTDSTDKPVTTTTCRFIDHYRPAQPGDLLDPPSLDDDHETLTSRSAVGQKLQAAQVGDTLTFEHIGRTTTVQFIAHEAAPRETTHVQQN